MLISLGDFWGVSKSSTCPIVRQVYFAIAHLAPQFIQMPSSEREIQHNQLQFYKRAELPRVTGAIDCTHVKIQSPGGLHAENFRNHKGYFSINVQRINWEDLRFLDTVARWPGSVHDQTIFNKSKIVNV